MSATHLTAHVHNQKIANTSYTNQLWMTRVSSRHLLIKANKNHYTKTEVNTTVVHRKKILQKVKCKTMQNIAAKYHCSRLSFTMLSYIQFCIFLLPFFEVNMVN